VVWYLVKDKDSLNFSHYHTMAMNKMYDGVSKSFRTESTK